MSDGGDVLASLVSYRTYTRRIAGLQTPELDLSWLDGSAGVALSRDGSLLVLDEHGGRGGTNAAYVRKTDGSPAIRLGAGRPLALSPDGRWVLTTTITSGAQLSLLPTGAGDAQLLKTMKFEFTRAADWSPDGTFVVLAAAEAGCAVRLYLYHIDGETRALTPEGFDINGAAISPDGSRILATGPSDELGVVPVAGGDRRSVPGTADGDVAIGWTADGRNAFVFRRGEIPVRVFRVDVATGRRQLWRTLTPPDPAGVGSISSVLATPDGRTVIYSYEQTLTDLYLIQGLE